MSGESKPFFRQCQPKLMLHRMNADNVLLTHFSARYVQMPPSGIPTASTHGERSREPVLALAFDHANIAIGDMWKMNLYLPAIEQSFGDIADGDDEMVYLDNP